MSVITIDGQIGAGGLELGRRVAQSLDFNVVDKMALPRSSAADGRRDAITFSDHFWLFVERAVSGMAFGNAIGDPYFHVSEDLLLPLTWDSEGPIAANIKDPHPPTVNGLFDRGNAVLIHRAGCVEAGDRSVLKVGLFASWEDRVARVMNREGLKSISDAEYSIRRREKLQNEYFADIHGVRPDDHNLYDISIDTSLENIPAASVKVAKFARQAMAI
tara:strand:- start:3105 stop:3755 length:651 start_codon:yes stop_codon:yes gene_type:complete